MSHLCVISHVLQLSRFNKTDLNRLIDIYFLGIKILRNILTLEIVSLNGDQIYGDEIVKISHTEKSDI